MLINFPFSLTLLTYETPSPLQYVAVILWTLLNVLYCNLNMHNASLFYLGYNYQLASCYYCILAPCRIVIKEIYKALSLHLYSLVKRCRDEWGFVQHSYTCFDFFFLFIYNIIYTDFLHKYTLTSHSSILSVNSIDIIVVAPRPVFRSSTDGGCTVHKSTFSPNACNFTNWSFTSTKMRIAKGYCICLKKLE